MAGLRVIPSGAKQAAEKSLILPVICFRDEFFAVSVGFRGGFCFRFASAGRFFGLQTHFGPNRPALQSESTCACAPNSAPRWSADRTNPLDQARATSLGAAACPTCSS